jgi:hypothetical protein
MANMVMMAGRRWGAEETMAAAKGPIGWDEGQFRHRESMQHHTALAGLAILRANIIRERLNELLVTSGTAGRNDDGSDPETREIAHTGNQEPGGKLMNSISRYRSEIPLSRIRLTRSSRKKLATSGDSVTGLQLSDVFRISGFQDQVANQVMRLQLTAGAARRIQTPVPLWCAVIRFRCLR